MSGKLLSSSAKTWKIRIDQWKRSGKSLAAWSRESNLVYSQCTYWKLRFIGVGPGTAIPAPSPSDEFIELEDQCVSDSGIVIEVDVARIHLSTEFDQSTFLKCLNLLKGGMC